MSEIIPWPLPCGEPKPQPQPILRPCDWGLITAVTALETQLGTIEAYNRLCDAAARLRAQIEAGKAKPQNPFYAVDPRSRTP